MDAVDTVFALGGPLARAAGPGYETRPGQQQLARHVWEALAGEQLARIEAGTGVGKTRGYLVPAIHWAAQGGGPVAISTHTRSLQDQLLRELRFLAGQVPDLLPQRHWRYAVLKGRRNYLCLHKLAEELHELNPATSLPRRLALAMLAVWAYEADQGDADEFVLGWLGMHDDTGEARATRAGALCDDDCAERRCPFYDSCYYFRAVHTAQAADVLAVNHALLLSSARWRDHADSLIFDEAHTLEDAATDALTQEVTGADIADTLAYLHRSEGNGSSGLRTRLARAVGLSLREGPAAALVLTVADVRGALTAASTALHHFLHEHDHKRDDETRYDHVFPYAPVAEVRPWLRAAMAVRGLIPALDSAAAALESLAAAVQERDLVDDRYHKPGLLAEAVGARIRLRELADGLAELLALADRHNQVYLLVAPATPPGVTSEERAALWKRPDWALRAVPVEVDPHLARELFGPARAAVLTSATLTVDGSFDFIRHRVGLDQHRDRLGEHTVPSPFDYPTQALLALPSHLPAPRASVMEEYLERLGQELVRYVCAFGGKTLALFTARVHIERLGTQVADPLAAAGLALYAQGVGARADTLVRAFKGNPRGLLMGVRTMWEGIDIPGPDLSHV